MRSIATVIARMAALLVFLQSALVVAAPVQGPLRVHPQNPRYFTDDSGRAILLVGSHTWNNLQDMGPMDPPAAFDFDQYLAFLERHHHNFVRLWRWELVSWNTAANGERESRTHQAAPHPWRRTGPGEGRDGKPKFDLEKFDDAYFARLRSRVAAARDRGVYVSVMLFEGWGLQHLTNAWQAHPFHPDNNVNGLDGDADRDGRGLDVHTMRVPAVTRLQEAYVRKVVDNLNDLDNVLFEIANESGAYSTEWQEHFIRFIHEYEKGKPRQHPVGMTFQYARDEAQRGSNSNLFNSSADWISPNPDAGAFDFRANPPAADGRKVILTDTDHLWGIGGDVAWVWKSVLRGLNPIFMDPYDQSVLRRGTDEKWEPVRRAMGQARRFAERLNLAATRPQDRLASTGYCLANAAASDAEYLVYLPDGGELTVDLSASAGKLKVEWFDCANDRSAAAEGVDGGAVRRFKSPFEGATLLYLNGRSVTESGAGSWPQFRHHFISLDLPTDRNGTGDYGLTALTDLNRDGHPDFILGGRGVKPDRLYWFEYHAADEWVKHEVGSGYQSDVGLAAIDVDGDGWTDLVCSGVWFRNPGSKDQAWERLEFASEAAGAHDIVAADVDGDGRRDIVMMGDARTKLNSLCWFRIAADSRQPWERHDIGAAIHGAITPAGVADLNGDGHVDVVRGDTWFENRGGKGLDWVARKNIPMGRLGPFGVCVRTAVADVDGDGRQEIVMCDADIVGSKAFILRNADGRGGAWEKQELPSSFATGSFHSLAVADLNRDGRPEIIVNEQEELLPEGRTNPRWIAWENLGRGQFVERILVDARLGGHELQAADVDGDGDVDLASKPWGVRPWNGTGGRMHVDYLENLLGK